MNTLEMLLIPPIPLPWVLPTRLGCTALTSSSAVTPASASASAVITTFQAVSGSIDPAIPESSPWRTGSEPSGNCPPAARSRGLRRGIRTEDPAGSVSIQPSSACVTSAPGALAAIARASASAGSTLVSARSRNTSVNSQTPLAATAESCSNRRTPERASTCSR